MALRILLAGLVLVLAALGFGLYDQAQRIVRLETKLDVLREQVSDRAADVPYAVAPMYARSPVNAAAPASAPAPQQPPEVPAAPRVALGSSATLSETGLPADANGVAHRAAAAGRRRMP